MSQAAIQRLTAADPVLGRWIAHLGSIPLKPRRLPPYQSLVQSIIYQQISGKAAATILGRFRALFGGAAFPTPEQVLAATPAVLASAGLSRAKARYVRDVAARAAAGTLPTLAQCGRLSDEELVAGLTEIHGVGQWTVEMFLIFNLGRPDVLPVHDLGVRRGFQVVHRRRELPAPEQLARFGARWQPYRTTAARYLWRSADLRELPGGGG